MDLKFALGLIPAERIGGNTYRLFDRWTWEKEQRLVEKRVASFHPALIKERRVPCKSSV